MDWIHSLAKVVLVFMRLSTSTKILLASLGILVSLIGFMVRLPSTFRHMDKELHTLFYFLAAAGLNILFAKRNILIHGLIFGALYLFGMGIEWAQEYSNTLFHKKIHGRFDIEDVQSNLKGLIYFSMIWILYFLIMQIRDWTQKKEEEK